jgi:UDPglucose--hexose-1-phosphate uridylyltransferase
MIAMRLNTRQPPCCLPLSSRYGATIVVRKTEARLADGRQLIYYDEADDAARCVVDERDLPPMTGGSTIRYDALADEWVTVAAHRQDRTYLPPADECPLCPSVGGRYTEIPSGDYDVVVFENRFPSFRSDGGEGEGEGEGQGEGEGEVHHPTALFGQRAGVGRCEVVCFTSDHASSFSALTATRVRTVVEAWADRTLALSEMPGVAQVFCFENRGREIGVTLSHPHGQIYGYPFVTPRTRRMLDAARNYRARTARDLASDILAAETRAGGRIVTTSPCWTAFVPFAARWPVEVHLYPNERVASLPELSDAQRKDFCGMYLDILRRLEAAHGETLPYISAWHQAPVRTDRDLAYLHLEISSIRRAPGKLKYLAGSESAMGAFVNDVAPEDTARTLRHIWA